MVRSRVAPNIQKCLEELRSALKSVPPGEDKMRAEAALGRLEDALSGKPQLRPKKTCPTGSDIRHT
jgi:hypothetical protein